MHSIKKQVYVQMTDHYLFKTILTQKKHHISNLKKNIPTQKITHSKTYLHGN